MKKFHPPFCYQHSRSSNQNYYQHHHHDSGNLNNNCNLNERNSSSGEDSSPILTVNTPDSGIIQSRNSLDSSSLGLESEMANNHKNYNHLKENNFSKENKKPVLNNNLNQLGQLVENSCNKIINFKQNLEERIHFDFLTATQLQRIIDYYKGNFRKNHAVYQSNCSISSTELSSNNAGSVLNNSKINSNQTNSLSSCFGCELSQIEKLTGGLVLPTFIEFMILYIMKNGINSVGVFRKSGVKSRINSLQKYCDTFFTLNHNALSSTAISLTSNNLSPLSTNPLLQEALSKSNQKNIKNNQKVQEEFISIANLDSLFNGYSVYDIADTIKTWLREIKPKPLISKQVILAFKDFSNGINTKEEFCFDLVSLMNDSERYVLLIILNMLSWFAVNSDSNQMNAHNLAICFAPSLCEMNKISHNLNLTSKSNQTSPSKISTNLLDSSLNPNIVPTKLFSTSPNINFKLTNSSSADSIYANENESLLDVQKCLEFLIENFSSLQVFSIKSLPFELNINSDTTTINGYDNNNGSIYLLNEGNLLPQKYESSVIINACPMDILERLLYERNLIDPTIIEWEIDDDDSFHDQNDIFVVKKQCSVFLPVKTFTLKRSWTYFDPSDNYISNKKNSKEAKSKLKSFNSKNEKNEKFTQQGITLKEEGFLYQSVYKITTSSEGKSIVQQSLAYDLRGHSFYWYQNVFPTIIDYQLNMLKQTFQVEYMSTKNIKSSNI